MVISIGLLIWANFVSRLTYQSRKLGQPNWIILLMGEADVVIDTQECLDQCKLYKELQTQCICGPDPGVITQQCQADNCY